MLSAYSYSLISKHVTSQKLSPNIYDKSKYVVHYENLRFNVKHGLQLIKVHGILKFKQSAWIKPYIDFNTAKRKLSSLQAHNKNVNTKVFGKTMECLRKRIDLELVTNPTRAKKLHTPLAHYQRQSRIGYNQNNRQPNDLSGLLYSGIVQNNHVQIPLRIDFAHVRITC